MKCKSIKCREYKLRRILYIVVVLVLSLTSCDSSTQVQPQNSELRVDQPFCTYAFDFSVACSPEDAMGEWDIVYTYFGKEIEDEHPIQFPEGVFSFHSVRIDLIETNHPRNSYSTNLRVGILNGCSGSTEMTVEKTDGENAVFHISCNILRVGM